MRTNLRSTAHLAGLLLLLAGGLAGCTPHHTEATQVGIKFNKVTGSYEIKEAGATYFFPPVINDWKTGGKEADRQTERMMHKAFVAEASLAGKLNHPHIVDIFDAVVEPTHSYLVMEYVPGTTLEALSAVPRRPSSVLRRRA